MDLGSLRIERVQSSAALAQPIQVPAGKTTSVIIQMKPFRRHKLWQSGVLVYEGAHKPGAVSITDLEQEWKCHHLSAFDNLRIQIHHDQLADMAALDGAGRGFSLRNPEGAVDRTIQLLAAAMAPSLNDDNNVDRLYVGHIANAMIAHLITVYGNGLRAGSYAPALSPRHERLALEYMRHHLTTRMSIEDIAAHCGLSTGHFTKAFSRTTGLTPHQWILTARVELAKELLSSGHDLASIAGSCGFADQSHFSRVFRKMTGIPPATWRRN